MSAFLYGTIGAGSGVLLLASLIAYGANKSGEGVTFRERMLTSPALSPLLIIHYFLPYGLIVLVLFMDIMSQLPQGLWSILIGSVAMVLNRWVGGSPLVPNDLCEIPGLKVLASNLMPQSLLFVTIVVTYLASFTTVSTAQTFNAQTSNVVDAATTSTGGITVPELITSSSTVSNVSPSPATRVGASWGLAISVILVQLFGILSTPGCLTESLVIVGYTLPPAARAILAVILGMLTGGLSGWGLATTSMTQPSYSLSSTQQARQIIIPGTITPPSTQAKGPGFVREQFQLGSGLGEMPMPPSAQGQMPVDMAKSSGAVTPGDSSDQFVCEAYKNGQLVSSTLT
jgi:hypothetical protein